MVRYTLNNSSIHRTYFLPTRQKSQDIVNPCPRTFRPRTRLMKANKGQRRSTMHNTLHHSILCYYFKHTTDFIGQNTRGRSPHASLDINTTSNYCPVSLSRVAQLVEHQTPDSEVPGSNPTNTQLFFSSFVESMFNTTRKSHLKKRKKHFQFECQFWKVERPRTRLMNLPRSQLSLKADLPVGFPYRFNSSFYYYFISFPLSAFCGFSAIFHRIFLIFGQLIENNL